MAGQEDLVKLTLASPEEVRQSKKDTSVHLYYRKSGDDYCCVVTKHLNGDGFVVTAYMTNKIKIGDRT